jgi:hypothetical protein
MAAEGINVPIIGSVSLMTIGILGVVGFLLYRRK